MFKNFGFNFRVFFPVIFLPVSLLSLLPLLLLISLGIIFRGQIYSPDFSPSLSLSPTHTFSLSLSRHLHLLFQTNFLIYLFFLHLEAKFVVCTSCCCCCRCFRVKRGNWLRLKSKSCLKSLPPPPPFPLFPSSSLYPSPLSPFNALKHLKFFTEVLVLSASCCFHDCLTWIRFLHSFVFLSLQLLHYSLNYNYVFSFSYFLSLCFSLCVSFIYECFFLCLSHTFFLSLPLSHFLSLSLSLSQVPTFFLSLSSIFFSERASSISQRSLSLLRGSYRSGSIHRRYFFFLVSTFHHRFNVSQTSFQRKLLRILSPNKYFMSDLFPANKHDTEKGLLLAAAFSDKTGGWSHETHL